jgi:hypothetical protein
MAEIRSGVKEGEMLFQEASQGKAGSFQAPQK